VNIDALPFLPATLALVVLTNRHRASPTGCIADSGFRPRATGLPNQKGTALALRHDNPQGQAAGALEKRDLVGLNMVDIEHRPGSRAVGHPPQFSPYAQ